MLPIYASPALGAYGYEEKPWYKPDVRLDAFVAALGKAGLDVGLRDAEAASEDDLAAFHTRAYIRQTTARCAAGKGSLDRAPAVVNDRTRLLLTAVASVEQTWVDAASVQATLTDLKATMEAFAPFLRSEGLVDYDVAANAVRLTDAGRAFVGDASATLGGPTYARPHIEPAARAVCGAVLDATRRVASGEFSRAFIPIAGFHHAYRDQARMYCLYNDPALAITQALALVDGPVAYIDVDIHHGDGVYAGFASDPRVFIADVHAGGAGLAPGSVSTTPHRGEGLGEGTACTLALGPCCTNADYLRAFDRIEAFIASCKPQFVVFEAGVDGLQTDPMSRQQLTPELYGMLTRRVCTLADEYAGGRLVVLGGGGYSLDGMAAAWVEVVRALSET